MVNHNPLEKAAINPAQKYCRTFYTVYADREPGIRQIGSGELEEPGKRHTQSGVLKGPQRG